MGALSSWPLDSLVRAISSVFGVTNFVETGTFMGDSSAWAAGVFPNVVTIEKRQDFRDTAAQRHGHLPIRFLTGDSADLMPGIVDELTSPALFWLDGHAGGGHFGANDDCPLLAELAAIAKSPLDHFVIIDDARAFLAPPPPPFAPEKWPTITDVLDLARAGQPKFCVVISDAIICVPPAARDLLTQFCSAVRPKI